MTAKKNSDKLEHHQSDINPEQLVSDFKALMSDAEALIKATAGQEDDMIASIRSKALETLSSAKESLSNTEDAFTEKVKLAAEGADDFVHRNPWEAIGVAAGLGLLIGLFIRRR